MYGLPVTVFVGDKEYAIRNKGDYRTILDCLIALDDAEIDDTERILSSIAIFYEDVTSIEDIFVLFPEKEDIENALRAMNEFFNAGEDSTGMKSHQKLIDWEQDEKLICAAVNSVAKCEIRLVEYMHWWTFLSYYMSIGDCTLSTVISIRAKSAKGKKLEKWEQDFKKNNPQHFRWKKQTLAQKQADDWFDSVWNK